jgi:hypothetical protein
MGSFLGRWAGHSGSSLVGGVIGTRGLVLLILIGIVFVTHMLAGLAGIATRCTMLGNDLPSCNVIIPPLATLSCLGPPKLFEATFTSPHCLKEHADDHLRGTKFAGVDSVLASSPSN